MRWCGIVGFLKSSEETDSGIYITNIIDKKYYGDMFHKKVIVSDGLSINENIQMNSIISIICDPYAHQNYERIVYCTINDIKWKVTNIEFEDKRIKLTLGAKYNEQRRIPSETEEPNASISAEGSGNWWDN